MRIRTFKPEFFLHHGLFSAEKETGLPLRLAFLGLWSAADREGRFRDEPQRLGVQILPYDGVDFSRVLHALTTRGFLVRYRVGHAWFYWIPTFKTHQHINPREHPSTLPDCSEAEELDASGTREARVDHASAREGKGREGNSTHPLTPSHEGEDECARHFKSITKLKAFLAEKYHRPNHCVWAPAEEELLGQIVRRPGYADEVNVLMAYRDEVGRFFPRSILGLLERWAQKVDEARNPAARKEPQR